MFYSLRRMSFVKLESWADFIVGRPLPIPPIITSVRIQADIDVFGCGVAIKTVSGRDHPALVNQGPGAPSRADNNDSGCEVELSSYILATYNLGLVVSFIVAGHEKRGRVRGIRDGLRKDR